MWYRIKNARSECLAMCELALALSERRYQTARERRLYHEDTNELDFFHRGELNGKVIDALKKSGYPVEALDESPL